MSADTAFCTSCGAVVGGSWEYCEACGAEQPVEVAAIGGAAETGAVVTPPAAAPASPAPLAALGMRTPAATYLFVLGGIFIVAGLIYLIATSGFPPGTTTTYEVRADGSTSTSTSPDLVEVIITMALFLVGAGLMRAARAANSSARK